MINPSPTSIADVSNIEMKATAFTDKFGRPLRVAHVGNIANNAYLAAKHQRSLGIDAVVFSPDYTHVMGFPDWEACSLSRDASVGHFNPIFPEVTFLRPSWFYSESWGEIAKKFKFDRQSAPEALKNKDKFDIFASKLVFKIWKITRGLAKKLTPAGRRVWLVNSLLVRLRLIGLKPCQSVLDKFDVIHFYGPHNYIAALYNFKAPFVSTEHGTIRDYVFTGYPQANMSKIGYLKSKAVHITNQDSLPSAIKLGLDARNIYFSPHPMNVDNISKFRSVRSQMHSPENTILVPARQVKRSEVETGKGNDEILKAIKKSVESSMPFMFLIPLWGDNVDDTIDLANSLGIIKQIQWIPLLSRPKLQSVMIECSAVIDQLNVKAYGAVGADALALGVPLITRAGRENDVLAFGSNAPVLDAGDSSDIFAHLETLCSGEFNFSQHSLISQEWFDAHLTMRIATSRFLDSYDLALNR